MGGASSIVAEKCTRAGWRDGVGRREQIFEARTPGTLSAGARGVRRKACIADEMSSATEDDGETRSGGRAKEDGDVSNAERNGTGDLAVDWFDDLSWSCGSGQSDGQEACDLVLSERHSIISVNFGKTTDTPNDASSMRVDAHTAH